VGSNPSNEREGAHEDETGSDHGSSGGGLALDGGFAELRVVASRLVGPAVLGGAAAGHRRGPAPAPVVVAPAPVIESAPVYAEQAPPQGYWYYCASSRAYYPSVPTCAEAWVKVPPRAQQ
jgi:hypothetical protein